MRPSGQEGKISVTMNDGGHDPRMTDGGRGPQDAGKPATIWGPFRRLMKVTGALAVVAVIAALVWLRWMGAPVRWELYLAVSVGVAGTLLLAGALMGLVFVSSQSGHDESVDRRDAGD